MGAISVFAQRKKNIIYVDYSATQRLQVLEQKVMNLMQLVDGPFLLFLSNDLQPIIVNEHKEVAQAVKNIYAYPGPSKPDPFGELDTINSIMSRDSIIPGLNRANMFANDNELIDFHFFFNAAQSSLYGYDKSLVNRLLLINRLLTRDGVSPKCKVYLYLDFENNEINQAYYQGLLKSEFYEKIQIY